MSMTERLFALLGDRARGLDEGLAAVSARWPHAPAGGDAFEAYLVARADKLSEPLRVEDLFLAWWASTGDSAGIAAFEDHFAGDIELLVSRFRKLPPEDLRQRLRIKLFVGIGTSAPSIHGYTGAGSLQGWFRVTASRAFVDAARRDLQLRYGNMLDELDELDVLGIAAPGGTPRDRHSAAELNAAIKRAFAAAVAGLAPRERTFLRHTTVDKLTLDQIAATYQVHRATVARTLKAARERLLAETRSGVAAELGVAEDQLTSSLSMLDSKLDLSLSRVLR